MTGQREGIVGDILDKVKDILTHEEKTDPRKQEDPPLETQCCGPMPPGVPVLDPGPLKVHDPDCPNHPDNVAKEEAAS